MIAFLHAILLLQQSYEKQNEEEEEKKKTTKIRIIHANWYGCKL